MRVSMPPCWVSKTEKGSGGGQLHIYIHSHPLTHTHNTHTHNTHTGQGRGRSRKEGGESYGEEGTTIFHMHDGGKITLHAGGMAGFFSILYRCIRVKYPPSGALACYVLQPEEGGEIRNKRKEHLGHLTSSGGNIARFLCMKEGKEGGYRAEDIAYIENIVNGKRSVFPCKRYAACLSDVEADLRIKELEDKAKGKGKGKTKTK